MNAQLMLYVIAFVVFIIGLADWPPMGSTRCIALGLALITLAQIIGK